MAGADGMGSVPAMNGESAGLDPSSRDFFEARYRAHVDPWSFATSHYELDRYERIITCLSGQMYENAFEPGCSVGVLTAKLAPLCRRLLATDLSPTAIDRARERCAAWQHVTLRCESILDAEPRCWDLLLLSEIGYYFTPHVWGSIANRLIASLPPGSTVLASHWLGHSPDHTMHGDEVHAILLDREDLHLIHSERHTEFRLEQWTKNEKSGMAYCCAHSSPQ